MAQAEVPGSDVVIGPSAASLSLFDQVTVEEVPLAWWNRVFAITTYPSGLSEKGMTHQKIVELAPAAADVNPLLGDFIQELHDLGSEDGSESIFLTAQAEGFSTDDWPADESPRLRAVRLWVGMHANEQLRRLVVASQLHAVERGRKPPVHEFVGETASSVRHKPDDLERSIEKEMREICQRDGLGAHIEVRVRSDADELVCHIVHGSRLVQPMAETKEGGRRLLAYRPVQVDNIRYEYETARLKISTRSAVLVPALQELFGRVMMGRPTFFANGEACTLAPLRAGEAALERHDVSTITGVKLVRASFQFGKHHIQMRGPDCFEFMKASSFRTGEGDLYEAKIDIRFASKKTEKRSVVVRTPNRIDFKRDGYEKDIRRYLEQVGIRVVAPKEQPQNIWTLYPWQHGLSRWRAAFGSETDFACRAGILRAIGLQGLHRPGTTPIEVVNVGEFRVGLSADGDVGPRVLSDTDIQGMELAFDALTSQMAESLSLVDGNMVLEREGFADLGKRALGPVDIRVFLMAREPTADSAAVARRIRQIAGAAHPVVVVPPNASAGTGLCEVALVVPASRYERVLRAAAAELQVEDRVPAIDLAAKDVRLVVDGVFEKAWLDGVPLPSVSDQPFKFLAALAAAEDRSLSRNMLAKILSPARAAQRDEAGPKNVKARLMRAIVADLKSAGLPAVSPGEIVRQEKGESGYKLCLPSWYRPPLTRR